MTGARYLVGDVFEQLATIPDASVDLVLTSPPFLALRSYLPAGHPSKGLELGSEATPPGAYIDTLCRLTEQWARVLAPHGSICVELGDTYSGAGGYGSPDSPNPAYGNGDRFGERWDGRTAKRFKRKDDGWPLSKSLCLIPELYRIALVYGLNPLTGRPTPRWRARNVIRWCRPNPPVGALRDKVRPATSDMVVACKSARRYFDLDAICGEHKTDPTRYTGNGYTKGNPEGVPGNESMPGNPAGAPPNDHWWHDDLFEQDAWHIPTQPYKGAHYATWPEALCVKPIEAMCPRKVCRVCGKPSERIVEAERVINGKVADSETPQYAATRVEQRSIAGKGLVAQKPDGTPKGATFGRNVTTLGWSDCGHDNYRTGHILDPFAGSGTTLAVAIGHGRDATGIDLDPRNADLAAARCGMFLTVDTGGGG